MNENILNALIHLFALVANITRHGVSSTGESIVREYLGRYLDGDLIDEYLRLFSNYYEFYQRELKDEDIRDIKNSQSLLSFQITNVCRQIQKGLLRDERIIVFLQLLEFVKEDEVVSEEERRFLDLVAGSFNIMDEEYSDFRAFIFEGDPQMISKGRALVVNNQLTEWSQNLAWVMKNDKKKADKAYHHIYRENLYGQLLVLHIPSIRAFILRYTGELNIYIEGHKIIPGRAYFVDHGAIIKGPNIKSIYYQEVADTFLRKYYDYDITLSGENIAFKFPDSQNGVQPFTFNESTGQLIGIMGGSGVGKSTLLNVLNGKLPLSEGRVTINGHRVHGGNRNVKAVIGFVPQDDLLFEELTVEQNLLFNAKLCFGDLDLDEIQQRVDRIIADLDLADIRSLKVGDPLNKFISGGQRKRLNIGLELMREPAILFVDEPTSGLSSMDSEKVMLLLKQQAEKGRLVVVNIHQPSSDIYKLLDKLWILDKGGYPIYQGNPIDAVVYFKTVSSQVDAAESECSRCGNIKTDEILRIIEARKIDNFGRLTKERRTLPHEWYEKYVEEIQDKVQLESHSKDLPDTDFKIPNVVKQFKVFSLRNIMAKLANTQYVVINLLEAPVLALILGFFTKYFSGKQYIFSENVNFPVFLFMAVVVALFLGLTVSAEEIIKDRKILERESFLNLSRFSYLNAKILFLFGLSALQTFMFLGIGYAVLEVPGMLWYHWLVLFTASCMGNMLGLNISSGLDSVIAIYILIPLILVPQLLLGGAMIKYDEMHPALRARYYVPLVADFMTTRWAFEAMAVSQFKRNEFEKNFFDVERVISQNEYQSGYLIPRLEQLVKQIMQQRLQDEGDESEKDRLELLQNELYYLAESIEGVPYENLPYLVPELFNQELAEETLGYLSYMKSNFQRQSEEASQRKEQIYEQMIDSLGQNGFIKLRQEYQNKKLVDIVQNRNDLNKIERIGERYMQKQDPIFMKPMSNIGRAHFFAPEKIVEGIAIPTLWFNILMMWVGSGVLYITLLFDVLRKIISYFVALQFRE